VGNNLTDFSPTGFYSDAELRVADAFIRKKGRHSLLVSWCEGFTDGNSRVEDEQMWIACIHGSIYKNVNAFYAPYHPQYRASQPYCEQLLSVSSLSTIFREFAVELCIRTADHPRTLFMQPARLPLEHYDLMEARLLEMEPVE